MKRRWKNLECFQKEKLSIGHIENKGKSVFFLRFINNNYFKFLVLWTYYLYCIENLRSFVHRRANCD